MFLSPNLTTKGKQKQLVNGFVHQHDYLCKCNSPAFHCFQILAEQLKDELSEKEKLQIKQCLFTGTEDTTAGDADVLGMGDLEKLFEEDFPEEKDG